MSEHNMYILGLAETNTHWNNGNIYRMALNTIKKQQKTPKHTYAHQTQQWNRNHVINQEGPQS